MMCRRQVEAGENTLCGFTDMLSRQQVWIIYVDVDRLLNLQRFILLGSIWVERWR